MKNGRIFFIALVLSFIFSSFGIANSDVIIKVTLNDTVERTYGNDVIAIGIEGEPSSEDEAQEADKTSYYYVRSSHGYILCPWTPELFKSPKNVLSSKIIFSEVTTNYQEYLKKDAFGSYEIEYRVRALNNKEKALIGVWFFYEGWLQVRPEKIIFLGPRLSPKKIPGGRTSITWGAVKDGKGRP